MNDLNSLQNRLKLETLKRTLVGSIFQVLLVISIWLLFYRFEEHGPFWIAAMLSIGLMGIYRIASYMLFRQSTTNLLRLYPSHIFCVIGAASAWGGLGSYAIYKHGLYSTEGFAFSYVAMGLISGIIYTLAAAQFWQRIFFVVTASPLVIAILLTGNSRFDILCAAFTTVFTLYLVISGSKLSNQLLRQLQIESELFAEKEKLRQVVDSVPGFVALADQNGNWSESSQSFEAFRNSEKINEAHQYFLRSGALTLTKEILWTANNQEHAFILSFQKLINDHHHSSVVVGVPANELFKMRHELESQRVKSEYSSRLATLGEMAAGIAHEINNPLAVILGNASQVVRVLQNETMERSKAIDKVEKIIKTSYRISKIIRGLRTFSRQGDQDPFEMTPLPQLVEDTLELCRERFYNHSVNLLIEPIPQIEIPMRMVQLSQVLINLLNNAFDAVKDSPLKIINVKFLSNDKDVVISISDSGPGIPDEAKERIFNPFFTTKEIGKGTGLGLSISQSIISEHLGELRLVPDASLTTFEIRLPRTHAKQQSPPSAKAS